MTTSSAEIAQNYNKMLCKYWKSTKDTGEFIKWCQDNSVQSFYFIYSNYYGSGYCTNLYLITGKDQRIDKGFISDIDRRNVVNFSQNGRSGESQSFKLNNCSKIINLTLTIDRAGNFVLNANPDTTLILVAKNPSREDLLQLP